MKSASPSQRSALFGAFAPAGLRRGMRVLLIALQGLWFFASAHADERRVAPPFGFSWGQSEQNVEAALRKAQARVAEKKGEGGGAQWRVEGLAQDGLNGTIFTFADHRLVGVELQYGDQRWTTEAYDEFVRRVRTELDGRLGEGRSLVRERSLHGSILQTVMAFRWENSGGSVKLVYFSAQDRNNLFRLASLHYSAERSSAQP